MHEAHIAELLAPFLEIKDSPRSNPAPLAQSQLKQISTYINILLRWNARINLTAVRRPEEIVTRHFGESLFAARYLFPEPVGPNASASPSPCRVTDLGSGAGFPGLPIKIWAPQIYLTLIESNQKKATFLREVVRALTLTDVDVFAERLVASGQALLRGTTGGAQSRSKSQAPAAQRPSSLQAADVVTLRAVEKFESVLPAATGLLSPGGRLALLIGEAQVTHARTKLPEFRWQDPLPIPRSTRRVLLLGSR